MGLRPGAAQANGRPPTPLSVAFKRGQSDHVLIGTSFGVLMTENAGLNWRWLCEPAVENADADPEWLWLEDNTLLAVTFAAAFRRSEDGGCTWAAPSPPLGGFVVDVEPHPTEPQTLLQVVRVETAGATTSRLFRSMDGGKSTPTLLLETPGQRLTAVRYAPSAPEHIYAASLAPTAQISSLYHSSDSGETWEELPFRTGAGFEYQLVGVDATDPKVVFAVTFGHNSLLRSSDGGKSFQEVLATGAYLLAFHVDLRTHLIWASDGVSGLYRSDDSGKSFVKLAETPSATCIANDERAVYICASALKDGFVVGRSEDGQHFTPFMPWFNVLGGPLLCPAGTDPHDLPLCEAAWPGLAQSVGAKSNPEPRAGAAGILNSSSPETNGCICRTSTPQVRARSSTRLLLLMLCVAAIRRRARVNSPSRSLP